MVAMILAIVLLLVSSPVSGDNNLCIFALPVGQGDATIIQCPDIGYGPGKLNIIDVGSSSAQGTDARGFMQIADVEKFILSLGSSGVENVFLTHPDIDHYSFFDAVHRAHIEINPFMDGSFSEWFACAESAPHLPSYLTAGAEQ